MQKVPLPWVRICACCFPCLTLFFRWPWWSTCFFFFLYFFFGARVVPFFFCHYIDARCAVRAFSTFVDRLFHRFFQVFFRASFFPPSQHLFRSLFFFFRMINRTFIKPSLKRTRSSAHGFSSSPPVSFNVAHGPPDSSPHFFFFCSVLLLLRVQLRVSLFRLPRPPLAGGFFQPRRRFRQTMELDAIICHALSQVARRRPPVDGAPDLCLSFHRFRIFVFDLRRFPRDVFQLFSSWLFLHEAFWRSLLLFSFPRPLVSALLYCSFL